MFLNHLFCVFFFQAEDGIRDGRVTGVQTCALPILREGNLSAIFFSIWMPSKVTGPEAVNRALVQIDAVREQVRRHPKDLVLATTAAEVREARKQGKIAA